MGIIINIVTIILLHDFVFNKGYILSLFYCVHIMQRLLRCATMFF